MNIVKTASGQRVLKITKADWEGIGKQAGWLKKAMVDYNNIPAFTKKRLDEIEKALTDGHPIVPNDLGSFFGAIHRNDLLAAVTRADPDNLKAIRDIVVYYNEKIRPLMGKTTTSKSSVNIPKTASDVSDIGANKMIDLGFANGWGEKPPQEVQQCLKLGHQIQRFWCSPTGNTSELGCEQCNYKYMVDSS